MIIFSIIISFSQLLVQKSKGLNYLKSCLLYVPPKIQYYFQLIMKRDRYQRDQYQNKNNSYTSQPQKKIDGQPQPRFAQINLYISDQKTINVLNNKGIKELFPIQQKTFSDIHQGFDMLARDRTGSGKTLAFSLPIIQRFRKKGIFESSKRVTKMIVILPTRQLAVQVGQEISSLKHFQNEYEVGMAFGGTSVSEQRSKIQQGCDIIVATPGRLLDFLQKQVINTKELCVLCLDQADEMLRMGFKQQVDKILRYIRDSNSQPIQTLLFSATLPDWIMTICKQYLKSGYKTVNMINQQENSCSKTVKHYKFCCSKIQKPNSIQNILRKFVQKQGRCILFCETKRETALLRQKLSKTLNEPIQALHGDVHQQKRLITFNAIKKGTLRFIVATNVAARGLDIPNIQLVVQYSPPRDCQSYIHRSGRTGRAGKQGTCITLYSQDQQYLIDKIQFQAKITLETFNFQSCIVPNRNSQKEKQNKTSSTYSSHQKQESQNKKTANNSVAQYSIESWKKIGSTPQELVQYIRSIVDICPIKTLTDSSNTIDNRSKPSKVIFQIPEVHHDFIMKMTNQFKIDGYHVDKIEADRNPRAQRYY